LFDRSEFLAEIAIRTPDLVDDLVVSGRLGRSKTGPEILKDLRHGWNDPDQRVWLRRYHQAEFLRIGLRSILRLADHEQNLLELSALADACLEYALDVALRRLKIDDPPLVIIGLGKLGGRELNYGSDLDIAFVAEDQAKRSLPKLQKVAVEVMRLLSSQTELGIAFVTDARLRPDGEKGLLVNTLSAFKEYYRVRAQLWEIQSLTRTRPIAGHLELGERFQQVAVALTDFRSFAVGIIEAGASTRTAKRSVRGSSKTAKSSSASLSEGEPKGTGAVAPIRPACFASNWKQDIAQMRTRIEKERTPSGQDALAFKTGRGGVMVAEFIAQAMCLEHGWHEPNTLCALQRVRGDKVLPIADADKLLNSYRQLRRVEGILRRWSFEGEAVLPADPAAYRRVAVRCGFESAEAFRSALASWRSTIREIYLKVFAV
jgi:glutamate-ammonia-ligase adenylyltransferase